ncbi:hypothetical protein ACFSCV_18265 [Methylopila henanensis]|uniref:Uncharacterized protein n=1 Tax=Methylopila henanensis TaxID=873516 RepID=A0ABW4K9U1_9HYPH
MSKDVGAVYALVVVMALAIGFIGFMAVSMIRQFLGTGSMMRGPITERGAGESEDPIGMRGYDADGEAGRHD